MFTLLFALLCSISVDSVGQPKYGFSIKEIKHSKEITEVKVYYKGKEIKLNTTVFSPSKEVDVEVKYKFEGKVHSIKASLELEFDLPDVTEFSLQIEVASEEILFITKGDGAV